MLCLSLHSALSNCWHYCRRRRRGKLWCCLFYSHLNQLADSRTFLLMSVFHPCPIVHIHRISIETTNLMTVLMVLEEEPSTTGDWVFTSSFAESYSFLDVIRDSIFCVDWICIIDVIGITTTSERDLIVIQIENEVEVLIRFPSRVLPAEFSQSAVNVFQYVLPGSERVSAVTTFPSTWKLW